MEAIQQLNSRIDATDKGVNSLNSKLDALITAQAEAKKQLEEMMVEEEEEEYEEEEEEEGEERVGADRLDRILGIFEGMMRDKGGGMIEDPLESFKKSMINKLWNKWLAQMDVDRELTELAIKKLRDAEFVRKGD